MQWAIAITILVALRSFSFFSRFNSHIDVLQDGEHETCAAFGMKDYPIPISTSNHLPLDLCNLKSSPQRVECNFLSQDLELMRTARETSPSASMLAES